MGGPYAEGGLQNFAVALEALEKRFDITRIMVVAYAGMLSKDNQKMPGDKGLPYILGYRMKSGLTAYRSQIGNRISENMISRKKSSACTLDILSPQKTP